LRKHISSRALRTLDEAHTLSFWDALIVEAARIAGASLLLSEDLQAGREIGGIRIRNPFAVAPG
jgi:predicted nucleic acid-binding protein